LGKPFDVYKLGNFHLITVYYISS